MSLPRQKIANAIRALSMDAVEKAQSGHPGMPMGMADIAEVLWNDFLKHNPSDPHWLNRDRFIVSNGHGSMLLYALLHLSGYDLNIEQIKNFRQLHSKTPGHPEFSETPGVETTTGPLGQGLANAVGMALAERTLSAQFNQADSKIIDHHTYVFAGDGCLMEGISHEACSLAGVFGLGKLIVFWDDNEISIDGNINTWMERDPATRFESYGWQVIRHVNGHDPDEIRQAIETAHQQSEQPTLICCRTEIGFGSPNKANKASAHGSPLGAEEILLTRQQLQWDQPPFAIPETIYQAWDAKEKGQLLQQQWQSHFDHYCQQYPELGKELQRRIENKLPQSFDHAIETLLNGVQAKATATRKMNTKVLDKIGPILPELIGGSADLTGSNNTNWSGSKALNGQNTDGSYIHYGVREFAMAAMMNGIALYRGFIPYGGTFLVFCSYSANALRMAALMGQRVIHVLTHDSIGLGEDGPTHQPIEQLSMLRAIPNFSVWRPCDETESIIAWEAAIKNDKGPTALCMTRQTLSAQTRDQQQINNIRRGGYVLYQDDDNDESIAAILIATGSEVEIAIEAAKCSDNNIRVVSMPSTDVFDQQDQAYHQSVLPPMIKKRIAIEAAAGDFWYKYVGSEGKVIALDRFGLSAPYQQIYQELGLTSDHILSALGDLK